MRMALRVAFALVALAGGGCLSARDPEAPTAALPVASVAPPRPALVGLDQRTLAYPHGRWQLYGEGSPRSPYSWVWIPRGATPPPSAPPAR
jgi:hypothetical protein